MTNRRIPEDFEIFPLEPSHSSKSEEAPAISDVERGIELERARDQLEARDTERYRVYMVSLELPGENAAEIQESLQELGALIRSLGDDCVGVLVQKRPKVSPATFIGEGKAEAIREACKHLKVDYVAFDKELSPSQVRNLEQLIHKPVLDRTDIILQIFRKNAKSREAKTQVEIARLEYVLPRLSNSWIAWERQRGGSGGAGSRLKGAGERQIELDRRRVKEKIAFLRKELEKIKRERETQRKQRSDELNVVFVGYTNAGKTSLMNALTDSHLSAKDALFETLDASVRVMKGESVSRILLTDTVGFIRNLPHKLIASFRSTLEESVHADLLLHVVDVSYPQFKDHMRVTDEVLREVGASDVPRMIVFNKLDKLEEEEPRLGKILVRGYKDSIAVSANNSEDIEKLRKHIVGYFEKNCQEIEVEVPYHNAELMGVVYSQCKVLETKLLESSAVFKVRMPLETYQRYFEEMPQGTSLKSIKVGNVG